MDEETRKGREQAEDSLRPGPGCLLPVRRVFAYPRHDQDPICIAPMKLLPSSSSSSFSSRRTRVGDVYVGVSPGVVQVVGSLPGSGMCRGIFRSHNDYIFQVDSYVGLKGVPRQIVALKSFDKVSRNSAIVRGWRFSTFLFIGARTGNSPTRTTLTVTGVEERKKEGREEGRNDSERGIINPPHTYLLLQRATLLHRAVLAARVPSVTERAMIYRRITCARATTQENGLGLTRPLIVLSSLRLVKLNGNSRDRSTNSSL